MNQKQTLPRIHLPLWFHKHVYSYICTVILEHHVTVHDCDNKQIQTTAALKQSAFKPSSELSQV